LVSVNDGGLFKHRKLVPLVRSEQTGYAIIEGHGMMEYWNDGIMGV
jgi:hypothetical protein